MWTEHVGLAILEEKRVTQYLRFIPLLLTLSLHYCILDVGPLDEEYSCTTLELQVITLLPKWGITQLHTWHSKGMQIPPVTTLNPSSLCQSTFCLWFFLSLSHWHTHIDTHTHTCTHTYAHKDTNCYQSQTICFNKRSLATWNGCS